MKKLLIILVCGFLLMPIMAKAADFRATPNGTVSVTTQDNVRNLYAAATTVFTDGLIKGDAVLAGSSVNVKGNVQQDLFAAAGNISVSGNISQNVRVAGGNVIITSTVIGQDLLVAGGTLSVDKNTVINGDLIVAGGAVDLSGAVKGNVRIAGGQVTINGAVSGSVAGKNLDTLTLGDNAIVGGDINYSAQNQANISSKATVNGSVNFTPVHKSMWSAGGVKNILSVGMILMVISSYLLLLALIYTLPKFVQPMIQKAYTGVLNNIGIGLLITLAIPLLAILLLVSILGLKIAVMLGAAYIFIIVLGKALAALVLGAGVYKLFSKGAVEYKVDWLTALIGVILLSVLGWIPFVGWIVVFVFFLMAVGALTHWVSNWTGRNR